MKNDGAGVFAFGQPFYLDADQDGSADFLFTTIYDVEDGMIRTLYMAKDIGEIHLLSIDADVALADTSTRLIPFGNITWSGTPVRVPEGVSLISGEAGTTTKNREDAWEATEQFTGK